MYPGGQLVELEQRKALIRARIAVRRLECTVAATEIARRIAWIDRGVEMWQRVSPFAKLLAVPAGFMAARFLGRGGRRSTERKRGKIATLLAVIPLIVRGAKIFAAFRATQAARARPSESGPSPRL